MIDDYAAEPPPFPCGEDERIQAARDFREMRERVSARVLHLNHHGQIAIERAVRVLRAYFVDRRDRTPRQGTLHWLMLVGDPADRRKPVKTYRERPDFEIWAFVDHDAYKGMNRYWGKAREMLIREVGHWATITLSVFTIAEAERFHVTNQFLAERYESGIILFDQAMDPPKNAKAQAILDAIIAAADALPERERAAFDCYRRHGLDIGRIARRLDSGAGEAEMFLSAAFFTLITKLGGNAHAHSLRPGVGDHPRDNLDLYHHPGDHDRLLAVNRYRFAVSFAEMMAEAEASGRFSVVVHQAAYAAEFALKAVLLCWGYSDDWNRAVIGLDLAAALDQASACSLPPQPPDVGRLIAPLARYHHDGRTPDQAHDVLAVTPPPEIVATIQALLDAVGQMTGYLGLPGEMEP